MTKMNIDADINNADCDRNMFVIFDVTVAEGDILDELGVIKYELVHKFC
ncbi:MAG: hypothetical protein WCP79_14795 [Bacillota bacterium]